MSEETAGSAAPGGARPYLSIVIPSYNEENRLGGTLLQIQDFLGSRTEQVEVLVVDDGSRDGTADLVREQAAADPALRLISSGRNEGKGAAVRRGFLGAAGERVLLTDADLSTPIEDLEVLEKALEEGLDLAIGSRALARSQVVVHQPWWREGMGKTFNFLVRALSGLSVRDSQCGFKLFRREPCLPLFRRGRIQGFSFDVEILVIAQRLGLRWGEVPVRWYNSPDSRVHPVLHSAQMFRDLVRIRLLARRGLYDGAWPASGDGAGGSE